MNQEAVPKLSIIIPIYNAEYYLLDCLESLKYNSNSKYEIILINDGSTDNSLQIAKEAALKDNRIRIIDKKNEGVSKARNKGLELAEGNYILFIDADDLVHNSFWEELDLYLENSLYDFIVFKRETIFKNGHSEVNDFDKEARSEYSFLSYLAMSTIELNPCWGKLYKRTIIQQNGLAFDTNMKIGEDTCFNLDYIVFVKNPIFVDTICIRQRKNDTSATTRFDEDSSLLDLEKTFHKRKILARNNKHFTQFKNCVYELSIRQISYILSNVIAHKEHHNQKSVIKKVIENKVVDEILSYKEFKRDSLRGFIEVVLLRSKNTNYIKYYFNLFNFLKSIKYKLRKRES